MYESDVLLQNNSALEVKDPNRVEINWYNVLGKYNV